jgi:hypothetical protein
VRTDELADDRSLQRKEAARAHADDDGEAGSTSY